MAGRLFVVGTPVGNLEDITLRALRVLGEVAAIACEDTRQTLKILNRYGIRKPLLSYFQPQEGRRIPEIVRLLQEGKDVALVSDAGTPGISDPGFPLIRAALKEGIPVVPIPGPSAVTTALSASGLPTHRFLFVGFPPPKATGLRKLLESLAAEKSHPDLLPAHAQDPRIPGGGRRDPGRPAGRRGQGADQDPRGIPPGHGVGAGRGHRDSASSKAKRRSSSKGPDRLILSLSSIL